MESIEKAKSLMKIKYDGSITLATGKNKKETHWKNKNILYSALIEKLSNTTRTPETYVNMLSFLKLRRII